MTDLNLVPKKTLELKLQPGDPRATEVTEEELTQSAAFTAGAEGGDIPSGAEEIVRDFKTTGSTERTQEVLQSGRFRKQTEQEANLSAVLLNPEVTLEGKAEAIEVISKAPVDTSLREEFDTIQANNAVVRSDLERDLQSGKINYLTTYLQTPAIVQKLMAEEGVDFLDVNAPDFLASVALPGYAFQLTEILNQAMPGIARPTDAVLPGQLLTRYKDRFNRLDQADQIKTLRSIIRSIEDNKFYGTDNTAIKRDMLATLLTDFSPSGGEALLYNLISIADLLALAGYAKGGVTAFRGVRNGSQLYQKGLRGRELLRGMSFRKIPGSLSSELDLTNPKLSKEMVQKTIAGDLNAKLLNENIEALAGTHILPSEAHLNPTAAPSINNSIDEILNWDGRGGYFSQAERSGIIERAERRAEALTSVAPALHINKTSFEVIEGGIKSRAIVGLSDSGFTDIRQIKNFQESLRSEFPTRILARDGRTNSLAPLSSIPKEHRIREFYLELEETLKYGVEDALPHNPVLKDGLTGALANYFTKSSWLSDLWNRAGLAAGDQKAAKARAMSEMLTPLFRLDNQTRNIVEDIIDRGDQIGKFFSEDELYLEWGHLLHEGASGKRKYNQLFDAYKAFKRFQQAQWREVNSALRTALDNADMKEIVVKSFGDEVGETILVGKPITTPPASLTKAWDPVKNAIVDVTEDVAAIRVANAELRKAGVPLERSFIELRTPATIKGEEVTHLLYKVGSGAMKVNRLPDEVMPNVPGRLPRIYEVTHIVGEEVETFKAGEKAKGVIPIKFAQNSGQAQRATEELAAADRSKKFVWYPSKELRDDGYANRTSLDYYEDIGALWYSKRGLEMDSVDGRRPLMPILDRIDVAKNKAAESNTLDLVIQKMIRSFEEEFGDVIELPGGKIPPFNEPLKRKLLAGETAKGLTDRRFKDAVAAHQHLALLTGLENGLIQRTVNNIAIWLADKIATPKYATYADKFRDATATSVLRHRNFDPVNLIKQAAFTKFILFNPFRQLALQAQQSSVYLTEPGVFKYFASGKGIRDYNGLMVGLLTRDSPSFAKNAKGISKALGMTVDEYVDFVDAFQKSGLWANIDSHAFAAGMLTDKTFGGGKGFVDNFIESQRVRSSFETFRGRRADAYNVALRAAKGVRSIGFDFGEKTQLVAAFLAKRHRWLQENPTKTAFWSKGSNLTEISSAARQISFEMTREGTLQFQKGALGAIFQFASHNTKALQALIPNTRILGIGKLSNKAITNAQRVHLWWSQAAIYGVGGYGLNNAWDEVKARIGDVPEAVDILVKEGLFGSTAIAAIRGVTGEPFNVDIGGSIGPFSGIISGTPVARMSMDAAALGTFDIRKIPAGSVFEDFEDTIDTISFLTGKVVPDEIGISEGERAFLVLDAILRNAPVYNNAMKAQAELAINRIISNSGDANVKASAAEILASAALGLKTTANRQYYEIRKELQGVRGEQLSGPTDQDLRDYAKNIYTQMKKIQQRTGDHRQTIDESLAFARSIARVDRELLDEFDYSRVHRQLVPKLIFDDAKAPDAGAELLNSMYSKMERRELKTTEDVIQELANSELMRDDDKKEVVRFLKDLGQ